ncbi:uncharacterized protein ARMOST_17816 [Armillaria ostoyae]|uniref:Uncharacterized protein n=1 Tax=Armillaria ostoyae TaxID=47428 RepID=A0A284S035_ARMOS|nr:uncharacterized protein ARMOST_17816 [Armillaria ostoyae]
MRSTTTLALDCWKKLPSDHHQPSSAAPSNFMVAPGTTYAQLRDMDLLNLMVDDIDSNNGGSMTDSENAPEPSLEITAPRRKIQQDVGPRSRTNGQQTWRTLSARCGYRPRLPNEEWSEYINRSLRNFGNTLLKVATDAELEAVRLTMSKGEYAHLVLTLDTTDYETQPEERAGNWVLSNTDLGDWGLKCLKREPACRRCIEANIDCTYTSSQRLNDDECRLCAVEFAHCEGAAARKRRYPSDATSQSTHSSRPPLKKHRTEVTHNLDPSRSLPGPEQSNPGLAHNLWKISTTLGNEVTTLRHQLESERETRQALEKMNSTLEEEGLALRARVVVLEAEIKVHEVESIRALERMWVRKDGRVE